SRNKPLLRRVETPNTRRPRIRIPRWRLRGLRRSSARPTPREPTGFFSRFGIPPIRPRPQTFLSRWNERYFVSLFIDERPLFMRPGWRRFCSHRREEVECRGRGGPRRPPPHVGGYGEVSRHDVHVGVSGIVSSMTLSTEDRIPEQGTVFGERTDSGAAPIFQTEDDAYFVI